MNAPFSDTGELPQLASLLRQRNDIDDAIARHIGRPAALGHLGEFIAARVFGIELEESAATRAIDGRFTDGALTGRTVNVKCYSVRQGMLDLEPINGPDYYLVLTGPRETAGTSRGALRPFVIESVFLFEATFLHSDLRARGRRVGTASSIRAEQWARAIIYPEAHNSTLILTDAQRELLTYFAPQ